MTLNRNLDINTSILNQLNNLTAGYTLTEPIYTNEQVAELHLQVISYLFTIEQALPQGELQNALKHCRWMLSLHAGNMALHLEVCLLAMQLMLQPD